MIIRNICCIFLLASLLLVACARKNSNENVNQLGGNTGTTQKSKAELQELIRDSKRKIKNGDLIERSDDGLESESMRNFSKRDKTFSHCGLAFVEEGEIYVYNTIAGEENPSEKIRREPFDSFVSPEMKNGFGIYRYALSDSEAVNLHRLIKSYYAQGLLFDKTFDLKSDEKMYCAELVYKGIKKATNDRIVIPTSRLQNYKVRAPQYKGVVLKEFEYVGLDDLFLNAFCQPISTISYK
jgi:hypothetical protein